MPQPELKSEDVFHVIGFANQDILNGTHMHLMQRVFAPGDRKLIEVYFVDPFIARDDDAFEERYGDKYLSVYFYNEAALALAKQHGIALPPVIGKITRAELPKGAGTSIGRAQYGGAGRS